MAALMPPTARAWRRYLVACCLLALGIALIGWLLNSWMTTPDSKSGSLQVEHSDRQHEFDGLFKTAVAQMQSGQYDEAIASWHRALLLDTEVVEVKVNLGFTLFELGRYTQARDFFTAALEQNAYQANAYYGLAIVSEKMNDLEAALGAMRSYIHLAGSDQDAEHVRRARAALWEWEASLAGDDGSDESRSVEASD